jgi:hypothetical protein
MGLFDGLGKSIGKFGAGGGGLLGGAHDTLFGTTPELTSTPGAAALGPGGEALRTAPMVQATGGMGGGLLDKIKEPDSRGLTFGDKLFATGSILQGDSGGAASYLANQRQTADALAQRNTQAEQAKAAMDALRGAIGENGQLDVRRYLAALPAGSDPSAGLKVRESLQPDITPMSGPRGAINLFDRGQGKFVPGGIAGEAREPELFNPDGSVNQAYIDAKAREAEAVAGGRRRGAPPVGRSGGGGRPKSYGRDDVTFN